MTDLRPWLETDILSLGMAADEARRSERAAVVTYLRVYVVTTPEIGPDLTVPDAAGEVRLHALPASLAEAVEQVRTLRRHAGHRRVAAYSMADLEARAHDGWGRLQGVLAALVAAGLSDVAEMPVDRLEDVARSLRLLSEAGARPRRVTTAHPAAEARLDLLERVRACRQVVETPLSYAPLPREAPADKPTTGYEDLRMVSLARLALSALDGPRRETSIEVDWSLYGPKLAQVALSFGADHLDGVSATSDSALGPRRATVADLERNIRAAGFEPQELRLTA